MVARPKTLPWFGLTRDGETLVLRFKRPESHWRALRFVTEEFEAGKRGVIDYRPADVPPTMWERLGALFRRAKD